ncbi:glycosyltransferase family 4 protein [Paludisphaera mucosa]|uniref:Glycosyltransferase family 4 protein n=1 Tax=Paludisphaera mucosa TaxID=3030827 RepID=A0ABT6F8I6_9BACT|nr:glycosyltransferase family 4 protein [Paludisphaera mucosa]MDG3003901.1 glycosyltransferase family 4 protein [Paludisphaera mucosa]
MRLLALVDSPDHVCCRYRIRAFEPALRDAGWSLTCEPLERALLPRLRQLRAVAGYDAVVLQRKLLPAWELSLLRRNARHLAFDFDDAVLHRDSYDRRGAASSRRAARFARTVRAADVVLAGNDYLADCALRAGASAETVRTIPTCVDPGRYSVKAAGPSHDGPPELVWIGSSSTLKGIEARRPLWERLGRAIPGLRLRVICDRFPKFENLEVVATPWSEAAEAEDLARGDVGVGLMPDDDWSRGKCGLKILQYQAAGLPVIANPVGSHVEMIEPGATGHLATTDDEWLAAVRASADAGARARMGREARRRVESHYSVAAWGAAFAASATGIDGPPGGRREPPAEGAFGLAFAPHVTRQRARAVGSPHATAAPPRASRRGRHGSE